MNADQGRMMTQRIQHICSHSRAELLIDGALRVSYTLRHQASLICIHSLAAVAWQDSRQGLSTYCREINA